MMKHRPDLTTVPPPSPVPLSAIVARLLAAPLLGLALVVFLPLVGFYELGKALLILVHRHALLRSARSDEPLGH